MQPTVKVRCLRGVMRPDGERRMGTVIELSLDEYQRAPAGLFRLLTEERDPEAEAEQQRIAKAQAELARNTAEAETMQRRRAEQAQLQLQTLLQLSEQEQATERARVEVARRDAALRATRKPL